MHSFSSLLNNPKQIKLEKRRRRNVKFQYWLKTNFFWFMIQITNKFYYRKKEKIRRWDFFSEIKKKWKKLSKNFANENEWIIKKTFNILTYQWFFEILNWGGTIKWIEKIGDSIIKDWKVRLFHWNFCHFQFFEL